MVTQRPDLLLAPGKVGHRLGQLARHAGRGLDRPGQRGVQTQDGLLRLAQLGPGLDAHLLDQHLAALYAT